MVCASGKATRCPTNTSGFAGIEYQAREAVATVKYTHNNVFAGDPADVIARFDGVN